jgi:hypothetical protein
MNLGKPSTAPGNFDVVIPLTSPWSLFATQPAQLSGGCGVLSDTSNTMRRRFHPRELGQFSRPRQLYLALVCLLAAPVVSTSVAGDPTVVTSAARPVAHSAAPVNRTGANVSQARSSVRPNGNIARPVPRFGQPIRRSSVPINSAQTFRDRAPRQTVAFSERREVTQRPDRSFQRTVKNRQSFFDALRRRIHERHDCNWWRNHFTTIVFVSTGYYYLDAGYWYPALGYDPLYNYDYDGPIYTYGDLLPDQVVANVQSALQEEGYYSGEITGSLGAATRAALAAYQRDHGLVVTGAIDEATVELLGLD